MGPGFTRQITGWVGPLIKRYFRAEVRGLDSMPPAGGALLVSNHSGGMLTPDVLVFAPEFYGKFGFDRPLYTLAHYGVFLGPLGDLLRRAGVIEASRENAAKALAFRRASCWCSPAGTTTPTVRRSTANVVDFAGRTGYVRTAARVRGADRADGVDRCAGDANCSSPAATRSRAGSA